MNRGAVRGQQAVHERLQAVGLLDDDPGVFAQARSVQLALEKLRRAPQSAEWVLDLVREVADQFPVCPMLRHALLLALDAQSLVDRAQLEQKSRLLEVDRSNDAIEVKGFLTRGNEDQVLIGKPALLADRLMQ